LSCLEKTKKGGHENKRLADERVKVFLHGGVGDCPAVEVD